MRDYIIRGTILYVNTLIDTNFPLQINHLQILPYITYINNYRNPKPNPNPKPREGRAGRAGGTGYPLPEGFNLTTLDSFGEV